MVFPRVQGVLAGCSSGRQTELEIGAVTLDTGSLGELLGAASSVQAFSLTNCGLTAEPAPAPHKYRVRLKAGENVCV